MQEQAKDISSYVLVRRTKLCNLKLEKDRCAIVAITIRNESVFDITIRSENITGRLFYNTKARRDPARVLESDSRPPIRNLEPLEERVLVLEQPLLQSEAETINDTRKDATARFWLGNLNIPISVENIPQQVESKRLRIGEHVEHLYLKDYNNDPLEELEVKHGKKLTLKELREMIDALPPEQRAKATKAALELYGESFYEDE